jgi:hypothetical protein
MAPATLKIHPDLREVRQRVVKPSEMISVRLPADLIAAARSQGEIRFELEEREGNR